MNKLKLIYSSSISSVLAVAFVTIITIFAELNAPLKNWLKALTGHHWTSKGVMSILLYTIATLLIYFLAKNVDGKKIHNTLWTVVVTTIMGSFALFVFYLGHHLGWY